MWLLFWLSGYIFLRSQWAFADRWAALAVLTLSLLLWNLWRKLPLNRTPGTDELQGTFGPGNGLSLARALAIGLLAGFLFSPWPWGALAWGIVGLYTAASIADGFDGYIARRSGRVTELGQWLDVELDGLGVLIVCLLGISYGQLPWWFLSVGLARYAFLGGLWWRERQGKPTYALPPSVHRRILAGMMMGMMTVVLWPIVPAPMSQLAALIIAIPVLLGFWRDWLFASGRLTSDNPQYRRARDFLVALFGRWLPLLWRLALPVAMFRIVSGSEPWSQPAAWVAIIDSWGVPGAEVLASLAVITAVLGSLLAVLGIAARLAVIPLLFPIGFDISTLGLTWINGIALASALGIALFGSGPYSLWHPENALLVPRGRAAEDQVASSVT